MTEEREELNKEQREELLSQIETFLGMGLLSLLVAAMNWGGHAEGGWGNMIDWIGRSISSLIIIGVGILLVRKRKTTWFIVPILLVILWIVFALGSIAWSYTFFIGIFILFLVYSILLSAYYLWSNRTRRVSQRLNKIIRDSIYARQTLWSALLLAGTITTWSAIRHRISGPWPDVVLIVCLIVVGILVYAWQSSIRQDK